MKSQYIIVLSVALLPMTAFSDDSVYCPQKQSFINIGMSQDEVIQACGQPNSKAANVKIEQKIPMTQLIYTTLNSGSVYPGWTTQYNLWTLPSGSTGTSLKVSVVDNKITNIAINGSATNAMSVCGGVNVQIGDDAAKAYSACGDPSLINNTYITQEIPKDQNPEVWYYQFDQYKPMTSLTFVDGKLKSIQ